MDFFFAAMSSLFVILWVRERSDERSELQRKVNMLFVRIGEEVENKDVAN